jgi:hypothetical protein
MNEASLGFGTNSLRKRENWRGGGPTTMRKVKRITRGDDRREDKLDKNCNSAQFDSHFDLTNADAAIE